MSGAAHNVTSLSAADPAFNPVSDWVCWLVEGVFILVIGIVGLVSNGFSLVVYSRQNVHRIFHNLLLSLALFDMVYVICSILLFAVPKFSEEFDRVHRILILPYALPIAHVGLMGSVLCTVAIAVERFIAVHYPFLPHRRVYSSRTFVLPIVLTTLVYNIPKFFELYVATGYTEVCEGDDDDDVVDGLDPTTTTMNETLTCHNETHYTIEPTDLRINRMYIRVYVLWMNLVVQILLPFILLIILNTSVFRKIKESQRILAGTAFRSPSQERRQQQLQHQVSLDVDHAAVAGSPDETSGDRETGGSGGQKQQQRRRQGHLHADHQIRDSPAASPLLKSSPREQCESNSGSRRMLWTFRNSRQQRNVQASPSIPPPSSSPAANQGGQALRHREVVLAKVSLSIVFVFLVCHGVRLIPNIYEMVETYKEDYNPNEVPVPWPAWISRLTNVSHFLLTLSCSTNFFIYYAMHGQVFRRRGRRRRMDRASGAAATATTAVTSSTTVPMRDSNTSGGVGAGSRRWKREGEVAAKTRSLLPAGRTVREMSSPSPVEQTNVDDDDVDDFDRLRVEINDESRGLQWSRPGKATSSASCNGSGQVRTQKNM